MPMPKYEATIPAAKPKETNVVCLDVARIERALERDPGARTPITKSPYDQAVHESLERGERNFLTAQQAYKEFSAAAKIALWDMEHLLKPAFDAVAQYLAEMDELDQDALLAMAKPSDAKAILLLQGLSLTPHT